MESCAGATHLHDLHRDDARRRPPRRASTSSGRSRPRRSCSRIRSPIARATPCAQLAREVRVPILFGSDQVDAAPAGRALRSSITPLINSAPTARPSACTARFTSCRLASSFRCSVDLPFAAPLVAAVRAVLGRRRHGAAAGRIASGEHGDLLRGRVSVAGARRRRGGQRAADDDHQRRLVRPTRRRRISTSRWRRCAPSSRAATWRAPRTPASAASWTRMGACVAAVGYL